MTQLGDLERSAAESEANIERLSAHKVEKLKQDIVDAQSAVTGARHEFAQVEAILRQEIAKLSSGMQEHERIAAKLDRITLAKEQERQRLQNEISTVFAWAEDPGPSPPNCARLNRCWKPSLSRPRLRKQKQSKPEMLQGGS
jgi:hypothetical protein